MISSVKVDFTITYDIPPSKPVAPRAFRHAGPIATFLRTSSGATREIDLFVLAALNPETYIRNLETLTRNRQPQNLNPHSLTRNPLFQILNLRR